MNVHPPHSPNLMLTPDERYLFSRHGLHITEASVRALRAGFAEGRGEGFDAGFEAGKAEAQRYFDERFDLERSASYDDGFEAGVAEAREGTLK